MSTPVEFESWYRATHGRLVASLVSAFGDRDLAGEAADEAIVRAWERWESVGSMASPDGWTFTCAFNVAKRKLRRRGLERRLFARRSVEPVPGPAGEIWHVVAALPERQRLAVVLRHVAQLRESDIAEVMGISRGGVSSTLRSAYSSLRSQLADSEPEPEVRT